MKQAVILFVPLALLVLSTASTLSASRSGKPAPGPADFLYGLASGPAGSLEFAVAGRLATLAALGQEGGPHGESGPRLVPLVEKSGRQAFVDLLSQPSTDIAIVPAPLLERAARLDPTLKTHVGYIAPLYLETVHVLVRADVLGVGDLAGRRVAIDGADGVGAALLEDLKVAATPVASIPDDPIKAIRDGTVDAVVVVGGDPTALPTTVTTNLGVKLLAVPYSATLERDFVPVTLRQSDLPSLVPEEGLTTVATPAVLAVYFRAPRSERAETLWSLIAGMLTHVDEHGADAAGQALSDVNWAAELPGWRRLDPVARWLDVQRRAATTTPVPITPKDRP